MILIMELSLILRIIVLYARSAQNLIYQNKQNIFPLTLSYHLGPWAFYIDLCCIYVTILQFVRFVLCFIVYVVKLLFFTSHNVTYLPPSFRLLVFLKSAFLAIFDKEKVTGVFLCYNLFVSLCNDSPELNDNNTCSTDINNSVPLQLLSNKSIINSLRRNSKYNFLIGSVRFLGPISICIYG